MINNKINESKKEMNVINTSYIVKSPSMQSSHLGGRNYSIDLLKIISMMMVLALHTNRYGGFLDRTDLSWYNFIVYYFEHLAIPAVDIFIIISSWFLRDKTCSIYKVVSLLTTILFWTVISLLMATCLGQNVDIKEIVKSIPFVGRAYDFLSGYIILYLVSPFLNKMLDNSTLQQRYLLSLGAFVVFSFLSPITSSHYLTINGGYSCFWFICLYIITSFLKEMEFKYSSCFYFFLYMFFSLIGSVLELMGITRIANLQYNNVFVVLSAFSIFAFFIHLKIKKKYYQRIISFFSPLTLGVFLIHDHNLMENYYMTLHLSYYIKTGALYIFIFPLFIIVIYVILSVIEYVRMVMFNYFEINTIIDCMVRKIKKVFLNNKLLWHF